MNDDPALAPGTPAQGSPIAAVETPPPCDPSPSPQSVPAPPGYEITCELDQGGMGEVYRARDCALDRPVALKYLKAKLIGHPPSVARFLHEAKITARLQ